MDIKNNISELHRLAGFTEETCKKAGLGSSLAQNLNLALEEAVSNVILYAFPKDGKSHTITVTCEKNGDRISYTIRDHGKEFDSTSSPEADIMLNAEERAIGGLGIHLIRKIMDTVEYSRKNGENILTLTKNI